jgi:hypothetical protein
MAYGDKRQLWIGWTLAAVAALAVLAAIAGTPSAAQRLGRIAPSALLPPQASSSVV